MVKMFNKEGAFGSIKEKMLEILKKTKNNKPFFRVREYNFGLKNLNGFDLRHRNVIE